MRTRLPLTLLLLVLPALLCAQIPAKPDQEKMSPKPNAAQVHRSALVIDSHADTPI
jgi:hypothetical protein